jgi:hypothetical protein
MSLRFLAVAQNIREEKNDVPSCAAFSLVCTTRLFGIAFPDRSPELPGYPGDLSFSLFQDIQGDADSASDRIGGDAGQECSGHRRH